jgi:four helix bundle protein
VWELTAMMVKHFRELRVYRAALAAATEIFQLTKAWPKEERYAMTDQIRRSSRSISANIAEAWRKRRYTPHFTTKLSDADAEAAETQAWLDHAKSCDYLTAEQHAKFDAMYDEIAGGLVSMMDSAEQWCGPSILREPSGVYGENTTPTLPHPHTPTLLEHHP